MIETNEEKESKVLALREQLRNGRRASEASEGSVGYSESTDGQTGSSIQAIGRNDKAANTNRRTASGNKRSPQEKSERVGPSSGRYGNDGSGSPDRDQSSSGDSGVLRAAIERIDDIPERIDNELPLPPEKPVGRFREDYKKTERNGKYSYYLIADRNQIISPEEYKSLPSENDSKSSSIGSGISENIKKVGETVFPGSKGTTLTSQEAKEFLSPLASALVDYGNYVDKYLQMQTQDPLMPDVWGDLTELEAMVLARIMIRRGQKSAAAASVVRTMVHGDDYIQAAIIVVPRVMKTVETMKRVPRKPKKGGMPA